MTRLNRPAVVVCAGKEQVLIDETRTKPTDAPPFPGELSTIAARLDAATTPEDVFGYVEPDAANRAWHRLLKACHPDHHEVNADIAREITVRANGWWEKAKRRIELGLYGTMQPSPTTVTLRSKGASYTFESLPWRTGDICNVYRTDGGLIVKVPRAPADNDLVQNEARTLAKLHADKSIEARYLKLLPSLKESFSVRTDAMTRTVNVLDMPDNLWSIQEVVDRVGPLSDRHMAWIWRRVLTALGAATQSGIVHGALLPSHVLISEKHDVVLIDWSYAVKMDAPLTAVATAHRDYYPPALTGKTAVSFAMDVFMGIRTMVFLMGGNPLTGEGLPPTVNPYIQRYVQYWWRYPQVSLPHPWALTVEFTRLIEKIWGPRRFEPLSLS